MNFSQARVLITGGASGIGRRMALGAAERGAEVVIWDRDLAAAEAVVGEIRGSGGVAGADEVDVTDTEAVAAAAERQEGLGGIDVLVNNAGVITGKALLDASEAQIRRTFEVNTLALYWTTRAFLPGMLRRNRGTVVTVASAAGLVGVAKQTDYSASKWAAIGFTESLRAELRQAGSRVRTLTVAPYYIDTGMFEGVRTRWPLLLPILQERDVARRVLDSIESGNQQLILPPLARFVPVLRVLPVVAFDAITDLLGVNETMTHFVGRAADASRRTASR